jgi:invasion protein IalB
MREIFHGKRAVIAIAVSALALGCLVFVKASFAEKAAAKPPAAAAAPAPAKEEPTAVELGWTKRCPEKPKDGSPLKCEVFQRLEVKQTHARVAEFAVGFPKEKDKALAAVVLPLGILLTQDIVIKIDDGKPMSFKVQYCTNDGCVSFIDLGSDVLEELKKGSSVHFMFKAMNNQNVDLTMGLSGFGKALKEIR